MRSRCSDITWNAARLQLSLVNSWNVAKPRLSRTATEVGLPPRPRPRRLGCLARVSRIDRRCGSNGGLLKSNKDLQITFARRWRIIDRPFDPLSSGLQLIYAKCDRRIMTFYATDSEEPWLTRIGLRQPRWCGRPYDPGSRSFDNDQTACSLRRLWPVNLSIRPGL